MVHAFLLMGNVMGCMEGSSYQKVDFENYCLDRLKSCTAMLVDSVSYTIPFSFALKNILMETKEQMSGTSCI